MARLTDIAEKSAPAGADYLVHIVDPLDTTSNPAGTSFKIRVSNLVGAFIASLNIYFNKSSDTSDNITEGTTNKYFSNVLADARVTAGIATHSSASDPHPGYQRESEKGVAGGYAELDGGGKVPAIQLPSYVDDVLEYANFASLPVSGETSKIYVTLDTNITYRWSGSAYVEISASLALGSTSATAHRGDQGAAAYAHSLLVTGNPHNVTKSQVGLANADNTSDASKPVSTAQLTAINAKVADTIADGVTTIAPSQNAVFDALAGKASAAQGALADTALQPGALPNYETPTGAIDGSNVTYTVTGIPKCIIYFGTTLFEGANGYSRSGLTITMPYAPTVSDQFKAII